MKFEAFRREYTAGGLVRDDLDPCPVRQFEQWLTQAVEAGLSDPTGMVLATVDADGNPWQRIVLLKGASSDGFVFYTNYGSAKARAIAGEPRVSLLFPWNELDRQVIVGGVAAGTARTLVETPFELAKVRFQTGGSVRAATGLLSLGQVAELYTGAAPTFARAALCSAVKQNRPPRCDGIRRAVCGPVKPAHYLAAVRH